MRILNVLESINISIGGPAIFACELADAAADIETLSVEIVAFDLKQYGRALKASPKVSIRLFEPRRPYLFGRSGDFNRYLKEAARDASSIFHAHSLWRLPMVAACRYAYMNNRPCVVSPHGAITPWALSVKSLRKFFFWRMVERNRLNRAAVIHTTSKKEANYVAEMVPGVPVAMIPLGTELPELSPSRKKDFPKTALFMSRIVPNKGIISLLEAWSITKPKEWKLIIAGPDEGDHLAECKRAANQYGIDDAVKFIGPVSREQKWKVYSSVDLFILPTQSENFGVVIAEALAGGIPVITTKGAPWEEIVTHKCGWWIEGGLDPLVQAMQEAFGADPALLMEMGMRGRKLIEKKYRWSSVAEEMLKLYKWAAGEGESPTSIVIGQ